MPPPITATGRTVPAPGAVEVSMANKTANAFLGCRRPVWLTAGARQQAASTVVTNSAASAAPERVPVAEANEQPPPAPPSTDPNLVTDILSKHLLSPAITVEASPLTNNPVRPSFSEVIPKHANLSVDGVSSTDDRQQELTEVPSGLTSGTVATESPASVPGPDTLTTASFDAHLQPVAGLLRHPSLSESAVSGLVSNGARETTPLAPAGQTSSAFAGATQPVHVSMLSPAAQPDSTGDANHNPYHPRVVVRSYRPSTGLKFSSFAAVALNQFTAISKSSSSSQASASRLSNLVQACKIEDDFFIALSQLASLWFLDRYRVYALLDRFPPAVIDHGFSIVQGVFGSNGSEQSSLHIWFAQFPGPVDVISRELDRYTRTIAIVGAFLGSLARRWANFLKEIAARKYPALMDELIFMFACVSPIMQALLSVDSRKAIPLSKETGIIEADRALALDQIRHQPAPGVMVGLPQANFALQIFKINADIIALYRAVFSHGETETPTHPDMTQGHPREELAIESEQQPRLLQLQIPTNHLFVPSISPAQQAQGFDSSVVRKISVQEAHNPGSTSPADFQNTPSKNSRTDFSQINASMRAQPISSMQALSQAPLPSALQSQQIAMTRQDMERQQCEAQQQQYEQRVRLAMQMQMQQSQTQYIQTPNPTLSATSPHTVQGSFPNPYLTSSRQPQINQYAPNQQTPSQQYPSQQSPIAAPNTLKDQAALLAFHQDQQLKELKRLHRLQRQQMLGQSGHVNMQQPSEITLQNAEHTHYWQQSQQGQQGQHSQPAQLWHHPIQQHLQQLVHQSSQARQAHPTAPPQSGPQDWQSQRLQQLQNVSPVPVQYSAQSVQRPLLSQQIQQSSGLTHTRDANGNDYAHQSLMYQNLHDPHKQNQAHHKQRANQVDIGTQHSRTPILGQTWKPMQLAAQAMISADPLTGNAAPGRSSVPQTTPPAPALLPLRAPNPALHNHFAAELQPGVRSREQFVSDAAVVDSSTTQPQNEVSYPQLQPEPQPVQGQVLQSSTDGALLSENGTVSQPQHRRPSQAARQGQLSIVPPVGTTIRRNEYPYFPTELRAVQMSLLQLDRRDPSQVIIDRVTKKHIPPKAEFPLFYQFIQRMAVGPKPTPMSKTMHTLQFSVTKMEHSLRSYKTTPEDQLLPIETLFDGSLDYRVRCCVAAPSKKTMTESEWAISDTRWPLNIFIQVNGTPVSVRRKSHNGKDLSVAITELIREGVNRLEVAIPEESHKSGPRPNFFFGVEMIETAHRHRIIQNIEEFGVRDASATIGEINARLQKAVPADDEFAVLQDSISVDLADPFSMKTCQVPVRGEQCQHIECFDLINWLNTRPCGKSLSICQHIFDCQCPQAHRPTLPYKWRCPICFKDARPSSLRIEKFLMNVRSELKKSDKLGKVKSILVGLDGKWDSFAIAKDDAESSGELVSGKRKTDDQTAKQPPQKLTRTDSDLVVKASSPQAATAAQPSRVVDIIEIQD